VTQTIVNETEINYSSNPTEDELKESMQDILEEAPVGELQELINTIKTTPIKLHISTNRALAIASTILERFEMPTRKY
jgi:hypothetical protein